MSRQFDLFRTNEPSTDLPSIQALIGKALFVVNDSGGADSQAMKLKIMAMVPADQIVVIHAHLPGVEWDGAIEHIQATSDGLEMHVVQATWRDGSPKTFFSMVEDRGFWPSPEYRQCTSDLKRGPIRKQIRKIANERGYRAIVNCTGLRADESPNRAKKEVFVKDTKLTTRKRDWFEWLPVHELTKDEVFQVIRDNGQEPHPAYAAGMTRFSCRFCIMSSRADLNTAARLDPMTLLTYAAKEAEIDQTFQMPKKSKKHGERRYFLPDIIENGHDLMMQAAWKNPDLFKTYMTDIKHSEADNDNGFSIVGMVTGLKGLAA